MTRNLEEEIKTIRERTISLNLSDEDCERISKKCGSVGLTISPLLENFIGDLVDGTYSNGSDERDYAELWFGRCDFSIFPEKTLLNHFLYYGFEPEDYLDLLDNIESAKSDKEYFANHPEEADEEELRFLDEGIADCEEEIKSMIEDWKPEAEPDMEEEISRIKKWVEEKEQLIKGKEEEEYGVHRKTKIR